MASTRERALAGNVDMHSLRRKEYNKKLREQASRRLVLWNSLFNSPMQYSLRQKQIQRTVLQTKNNTRTSFSSSILCDLPDEMILYIFTFMDSSTVRNCTMVNKHLTAIGGDNALWRFLCERDLDVTTYSHTIHNLAHCTLDRKSVILQLSDTDKSFPFRQLYQWQYETQCDIKRVVEHGDKWLKPPIHPSIVFRPSIDITQEEQKTQCLVYRGYLITEPGADDSMHYRGEMIRKEGVAIFHGTGVLKLSDFTYRGEFKDNLLDGYGTIHWNTGDSYTGQFQNTKRHGKGIYKWANGSYYVGDYVDNKRQGQGVCCRTNGSIYRGAYDNGQGHGHGTICHKDGSSYTGNFERDEPHGFGRMLFPVEHIEYEGEMKKGLFHGKGVLRWHKTGAEYKGIFHHGCRKGRGTLHIRVPLLDGTHRDMVVEQLWSETSFSRQDMGYYRDGESTLHYGSVTNLSVSILQSKQLHVPFNYDLYNSDSCRENTDLMKLCTNQVDSSVTDEEGEESREQCNITSPPRCAMNRSRSNSPHNTFQHHRPLSFVPISPTADKLRATVENLKKMR